MFFGPSSPKKLSQVAYRLLYRYNASKGALVVKRHLQGVPGLLEVRKRNLIEALRFQDLENLFEVYTCVQSSQLRSCSSSLSRRIRWSWIFRYSLQREIFTWEAHRRMWR